MDANQTVPLDASSPDSQDIKSLLTIISITTSSFSLLGCASIMMMYIGFQILQNFSFKLIFFLAFSMLIRTIGNLIVTSDDNFSVNHDSCVLQSFFINFGGLSTIFWTFLCCHYLKNILKSVDGSYRIKDFSLYSFGFGIPFLLSFMYLFKRK